MRPAHMYSPFKHVHVHVCTHKVTYSKLFPRGKNISSLCVWTLSVSVLRKASMMKDKFHITKYSLPGFDSKSIL